MLDKMNNSSIIPPPPVFWKYTAHLLRCCAQINPQRIKDTPAVNLCLRLVSVPSISKSFFTLYSTSTSLLRTN